MAHIYTKIIGDRSIFHYFANTKPFKYSIIKLPVGAIIKKICFYSNKVEYIVNKSELIDSMAAKAGISKADTARALNAFVETVKETLASGDQISLVDFGTFLVRERAARTGLNPLTKEKLEIPAAKVPAFKAGKTLKELVNK